MIHHGLVGLFRHLGLGQTWRRGLLSGIVREVPTVGCGREYAAAATKKAEAVTKKADATAAKAEAHIVREGPALGCCREGFCFPEHRSVDAR